MSIRLMLSLVIGLGVNTVLASAFDSMSVGSEAESFVTTVATEGYGDETFYGYRYENGKLASLLEHKALLANGEEETRRFVGGVKPRPRRRNDCSSVIYTNSR